MGDSEKAAFLQIDQNGLETKRPAKWKENPQHITREFDGITVSSRFDSGNLEECEQVGYNNFDLYISPDSAPYADEEFYRSYYQFLVTGVPNGDTLSFSI